MIIDRRSSNAKVCIFLQDAIIHLADRHNTRSMFDIYKGDQSDHAAIKILEALSILCLYLPRKGTAAKQQGVTV